MEDVFLITDAFSHLLPFFFLSSSSPIFLCSDKKISPTFSSLPFFFSRFFFFFGWVQFLFAIYSNSRPGFLNADAFFNLFSTHTFYLWFRLLLKFLWPILLAKFQRMPVAPSAPSSIYDGDTTLKIILQCWLRKLSSK